MTPQHEAGGNRPGDLVAGTFAVSSDQTGRMVERAPSGMRTFRMRRQADASGVSGIGLVLEGVEFSTGVVVVHWLTPPPRGSISVFDSIDQFLSIHVRPHPGNRTTLDFDDGAVITFDHNGELVVST